MASKAEISALDMPSHGWSVICSSPLSRLLVSTSSTRPSEYLRNEIEVQRNKFFSNEFMWKAELLRRLKPLIVACCHHWSWGFDHQTIDPPWAGLAEIEFRRNPRLASRRGPALAGTAAERLFFPDVTPMVATTDLQQAAAWAKFIGNDLKAAAALLDFARRAGGRSPETRSGKGHATGNPLRSFRPHKFKRISPPCEAVNSAAFAVIIDISFRRIRSAR